MAGGLIGTGLGYQNNAISGFIRESAEQQDIDIENQKLKAEKKMQNEQLLADTVGPA